MPSRHEIVSSDVAPTPAARTPWVNGAAPGVGVEVVDSDPVWAHRYDQLAARIRGALGWRVVDVEHDS